MKFTKKGQAALEFISTYGWALLVILVAVGALYYFGVFDMSSKIPEGCMLGGAIGCGDVFNVEDDGTLILYLTNTGVRPISVDNVSLSQKAGGSGECTDTLGQTIGSGKTEKITAALSTDCGLINLGGTKASFDVEIDYTIADISKTVTGTLTATVQES